MKPPVETKEPTDKYSERALITRALLLAIAVLAGCSPAPAPPVPSTTTVTAAPKRFDFNGDTPGVMTLEQFRAKYPSASEARFDVMVPGETLLRLGESAGLTIENVKVDSAHYDFLDGRLMKILVAIYSDRNSTVAKALAEKHGEGTPVPMNDHQSLWETNESKLIYDSLDRSIIYIDRNLEAAYRSRLPKKRPMP